MIEFDGPLPTFNVPPDGSVDLSWDDRRLTITASWPASTLAPLLTAHPDAAAHLRAIELHPPTLDDLYRHLLRS